MDREIDDDQLLELLYGELDAEEEAVVRRAIDDDTSLAERYDELRTQREVVKAAVPPPEDVPDRVRDQIMELAAERGGASSTPRRDSRSVGWRAWTKPQQITAVGSALAVVAAAGVLFMLATDPGWRVDSGLEVDGLGDEIVDSPVQQAAEAPSVEQPPGTSQIDEAEAAPVPDDDGQEAVAQAEEELIDSAIASARDESEEEAQRIEEEEMIVAERVERTAEPEPSPRPQPQPEPPDDFAADSDDADMGIGGMEADRSVDLFGDDAAGGRAGPSAEGEALAQAPTEADDEDEEADDDEAAERHDEAETLVAAAEDALSEGDTTEVRYRLDVLDEEFDADELDDELVERAEELRDEIERPEPDADETMGEPVETEPPDFLEAY